MQLSGLMTENTQSKLYGKGVFTTVAFADSASAFWDKHWRRLRENCSAVGIDISCYSEAKIAGELALAIEASGLPNGRARITITDESPSCLWDPNSHPQTQLSILTAPKRDVPEKLSLSVSPHASNTTSPLSGIKSSNYLEHLMSFQEANTRGFDEAVRLNERGELTSACMANLFWLKGVRLYTPSLKTGCLAGTTREFVIENLACEEVEAGIEALREADEIFLTSAGIGVVQVAEFDGRRLRYGDHPIKEILPF